MRRAKRKYFRQKTAKAIDLYKLSGYWVDDLRFGEKLAGINRGNWLSGDLKGRKIVDSD